MMQIEKSLLSRTAAIPGLPEKTVKSVDYRVTDRFGLEFPVGFGIRWYDETHKPVELNTCEVPYNDWSVESVLLLRDAFRLAWRTASQEGHFPYAPEKNVRYLGVFHDNWWPFDVSEGWGHSALAVDDCGVAPTQIWQQREEFDGQEMVVVYSEDRVGDVHATVFTSKSPDTLYAHFIAGGTLGDYRVERTVGALHAAAEHVGFDLGGLRGMRLGEGYLGLDEFPAELTLNSG